MATTGKIGVTTENIFPVIKKFLYSDHEIFLRELVANAVDATQKMKALAASGEYAGELGELAVRIELDETAKTLKIIDNGIGMTAEEVDKYINQIAFSSAGEFLEKYKDQLSSIIGHFGLGFYSAFMVAEKVTEAAQHILVSLVPQALREGNFTVAESGIYVGAQERCLYGGFRLLRPCIGNVQHTAHAVSVFGVESSGGEFHLFHHVAVDYR